MTTTTELVKEFKQQCAELKKFELKAENAEEMLPIFSQIHSALMQLLNLERVPIEAAGLLDDYTIAFGRMDTVASDIAFNHDWDKGMELKGKIDRMREAELATIKTANW